MVFAATVVAALAGSGSGSARVSAPSAVAGDGAPGATAPRVACTWTDAPWNVVAEVGLAGAEGPFASLVGAFTFTGELVGDADGVVVRGRWTGEGVTIAGELDAGESAGFVLLDGPLAMGPLVLVDDAPLLVHGVGSDGLVVGPAENRFVAFEPVSAPRSTLPCDRIAAQRDYGRGAEWYRAAGLSGEARAIDTTEAVPVHDGPGGAVVGVLRGGERPREVALLEERDGWSRVAGLGAGWVWHGWIRAALVEGGVERPRRGGSFGGRLPPIAVRACADPLALLVAWGDRVVEIGAIEAGVPLRVGEPRGEMVSVVLHRGGIQAAEGATLLVPRRVLGCREAEG